MMNHEQIYTVGGTVQAGGGVYIPRRADDELLQLCRAGEFAYVLTSRQMGKSSLMVRAAEALAAEETRSVIIDLTQLGVQVSAQEWYLGLLTTIEDALMLDTDVVSWWQEQAHLGVTNRLTLFFEEVLLKEVAENIVIFIDEIDSTLNLPFTDDFYAAIRFMYNARAFTPEFRRLSFVLVGVATPGDLISDSRRTPFNIGRRVDLTDFTFEEALPLANGLKLPPEEARLVLGWILGWTGGHPYLTQRTCRIVADDGRDHWTEKDIDRMVADTFLGEMSEQDNNLQFVRDMLTKRAPNVQAVLTTYGQIRLGKRPVPDEEQSLVKSHLKLSGAVKRHKGMLVMRNRIYAEAFNPRWVKSHIPFDEKRRRIQFVIMGVGLGVALFVAISAVSLLLETVSTIQANQATVEAVSATQTVIRGTAVARERATATAQALEQATAAAQVASAEIQTDLANSRRLAAEAINQLDEGDPDLALLLSLQAGTITDTWETRSSLLTTLQRYPVSVPIIQLDVKTNVWSLAFSSDGSLLAAGTDDGTVVVWDLNADPPIPVYTLDAGTARGWKLAFSPNSQLLATGSEDGELVLWDLSTGEARYRTTIGEKSTITGIVFSPDSKQLFVGSTDAFIHYWSSLEGTLSDSLLMWDSHNAIVDMNASADGQTLAAITENGYLALFDMTTRRQLTKSINIGSGVSRVALDPTGSTFIAGFDDGSLEVWDAVGQYRLNALPPHKDGITGVAYSPDGSLMLSSSWNYDDTRLWNAAGRQLSMSPVFGHISTFSPDGQTIASAGCAEWTDNACNSGKIVVGRVAIQPRADTALTQHAAGIVRVAFNPQNPTQLATADDEGTITLDDVSGGENRTTLSGKAGLLDLAFSPDGQALVAANNDNTLTVWDVESTEPTTFAVTEHRNEVLRIAFNPDGTMIVTAGCFEIDKMGFCTSGEIRRWDTATGKPIGGAMVGHTGAIFRLAFSPDGKTLVSGGEDGSVVWWNVQSGEQVGQSTARHTSDVLSFAFHPDGKTLVSGSCRGSAIEADYCNQGEIIIWDTETREPKREPLALHGGWVTDLAFSATGQLMASAACNSHNPDTGDCTTGEIYLWDGLTLLPMGKPLVTPGGGILSVALNADGTWLAEGSTDGSVTAWTLDPQTWQTRACNLVSRNLSRAEWVQFIDPELPYEPTCPNLPAGEETSTSPEQQTQ